MRNPADRFGFYARGQRPPRTPILAQAAASVDGEAAVAIMRLYDPVDSWGGEWGVSAKEVADVLDELPEDVQEIRLHLNSPGGEVFEGLAILNQLRAHRARVVTVVDGIAASIASVIAMAGDEVVVSPNSEMMIHDAWGLAVGNAADMRALADTLDHLSDNIAGAYARKSGGDAKDWRALMRAETWFGAEEAVAAGLADRVADAAPVDAKAAFDLSAFRYSGRAAAPDPHVPAPAAPAAAESNLDLRFRLQAQRLGLPA